MARSGSHLLCDGLRATRNAGRPKRFFYEPLEKKYGNRYALDPGRDYAAYVRGIRAAVSTPNVVFGFKLMGWDLVRLTSKLRATREFAAPDASEIELLRCAFPRLQFIQLSRRDKLRQAISQARALQTDLWKVGNGKAPMEEAKFDVDQIAHCLESATADFFARNEVEPFRLTYEQLCRDYKGTVTAVLKFLLIRLSRKMSVSDPTTIRQTDAITAQWEERYRTLTGGLSHS